MKLSTTIVFTLCVLFYLFSSHQLNAQTSAQSGPWNTTTTWVGGVVPGAAANVIIASGHTVTLDVSTTPNTVTINSGGTLTQNTNGISLGSTGYITTITVNGTLTIGSNCVTFPCMKVTGMTVGTGGIFTNSAGNAAAIDVTNFTVNNGGTYNHAAAGSVANGVAADFPGSTSRTLGASSTVNITRWATNAAAIIVALPTLTWGNLTINVSNVYSNTLVWQQSGALNTINGNLTIANAGTGPLFSVNEFVFNVETAPATVTIQGDFTVSIPTNNQINLVRGGTSNASAITFNVNGNFSMSNGVINVGQNSTITTINFTGNFSATGGQISRNNSSTSKIMFIKASGTQTYSDNGFAYTSPVAMNMGNGTTTNTVQLTGGLTTLGALTVALNCILTAGSNNIAASGNLFVTGILTTTGTINCGDGTGTGVTVSGTLTSSGDISVNCTFLISAAGVVNYSTGIIRINSVPHNFTVNGIMNLGNGTLRMSSNFNGGTCAVNSGGVFDMSVGLLSVGQGTTTIFTAASGSTLKIGSPDGITTKGVMSGNIQFPGTGLRTYNAGANYVYDGAANQITGSGLLATVNTFEIVNTGAGGNNTVTLTNDSLVITSITNSLKLTSGLFTPGSSTLLTIPDGGTVTSTTGDFVNNSNAGTITFLGLGTIAAAGTLNFYNATLASTGTLKGVNFGATGTPTINGTLRLNTNRFVNTNAPVYATGSTLLYNMGVANGRNVEWSAVSGAGYPYNVQISNSTALDLGANSGTGTARQCAGNLTVDFGCALYMDSGAHDMTQALTIFGNLNLAGTLSLSDVAGGNLNLKGNWTRTGTFSPKSRLVSLTGTTSQSLIGATTFDDLTINNTKAANAIILANSITVNGILTLTDGHIITSSSNTLTLGTAATFTLNASTQDSSFIKGPMIHTVAINSGVTKVFPVGQGRIMHRADLTVTDVDVTPTQYTGEYNNTSATALGYTLPGTLTKVSDISYWTISKGAGSTVANASVKLFYFASDGVSDATNLRVAKDNGSAAWIDLGGTGTAAPSGTIISDNFNSFSKFSLANNIGGVNVLPIELLYFSAELNESIVDLSWATASELNNDSFMVERSPDGFNFETIVKSAGAGNSNQMLNYSSTDETPLTGLSYYRLKQTDFDGTKTYSNITSVYIGSSADHFMAYPNPVIGTTINLILPNESVKEVQVIIYNMKGQEVFSKKVTANADGSFTIVPDRSEELSSGMYLLSLISDTRLYQEKLIIQ